MLNRRKYSYPIEIIVAVEASDYGVLRRRGRYVMPKRMADMVTSLEDFVNEQFEIPISLRDIERILSHPIRDKYSDYSQFTDDQIGTMARLVHQSESLIRPPIMKQRMIRLLKEVGVSFESLRYIERDRIYVHIENEYQQLVEKLAGDFGDLAIAEHAKRIIKTGKL